MRCAAFPSACHRAARWRWWANPAPANRCSARRSWASCPMSGEITGGRILLDDPATARHGRSTSPRCRATATPCAPIRGGRISIIFQEPMTSLSPIHTIGDQIAEALHLHREVEHGPRAGTDAGHAAAGRISRSGAGAEDLSVRTVRRSAPAGDDRHGAGLPAGAADRRRADHGPRRHHPGADPEADARSAARAGHGRADHHP